MTDPGSLATLPSSATCAVKPAHLVVLLRSTSSVRLPQVELQLQVTSRAAFDSFCNLFRTWPPSWQLGTANLIRINVCTYGQAIISVLLAECNITSKHRADANALPCLTTHPRPGRPQPRSGYATAISTSQPICGPSTVWITCLVPNMATATPESSQTARRATTSLTSGLQTVRIPASRATAAEHNTTYCCHYYCGARGTVLSCPCRQ